MKNITAIRGFNDILPRESARWNSIENIAKKIFSLYGFSEIRLPILEKTELFKRSIGDTTDIVEKQMYTFEDNRGDSLTLRPEGTAPCVRAFIENKLYATEPSSRLFYTGPMFRYERPQKGRFRQFYQIGAEVLGESAPSVDAETLKMLTEFFEALGLKDLLVQINSLGCKECRPEFKKALTDFLSKVRSELCENCERRMDTNPLRALDCKAEKCISATKDAPEILDFLCTDCSNHFDEVNSLLKLHNVNFQKNPRMVRGLDYYTRTTFEVLAPGLGSQNTVAAGGRYDTLVKDLGGPDTPCFGFAIGMERLSLVIEEIATDKLNELEPPCVFIACGGEATQDAVPIASELRSIGVRLITDFSTSTLKTKMKRANRLGALKVLILAEIEAKEKEVTIKDMVNGEQFKVKYSEVVSRFKSQKTNISGANS